MDKSETIKIWRLGRAVAERPSNSLDLMRQPNKHSKIYRVQSQLVLQKLTLQ
jgi:hypothetical protein